METPKLTIEERLSLLESHIDLNNQNILTIGNILNSIKEVLKTLEARISDLETSQTILCKCPSCYGSPFAKRINVHQATDDKQGFPSP